jgi:hypothetical protein
MCLVAQKALWLSTAVLVKKRRTFAAPKTEEKPQ